MGYISAFRDVAIRSAWFYGRDFLTRVWIYSLASVENNLVLKVTGSCISCSVRALFVRQVWLGSVGKCAHTGKQILGS